MNHRPQRYARTDPFPRIPFDFDERDTLPTAAEAIGWLMIAACVATGLFVALGIE